MTYGSNETLAGSTTTALKLIRRRRSTKRRAWSPTARFFLGWFFRRMNG